MGTDVRIFGNFRRGPSAPITHGPGEPSGDLWRAPHGSGWPDGAWTDPMGLHSNLRDREGVNPFPTPGMSMRAASGPSMLRPAAPGQGGTAGGRPMASRDRG